MELYIGTKIVLAEPMSRGAYVEYRGWDLPDGEEASDAGYIVEYTDGGKPNMPDHEGYVSWSPKEQFEMAYRETAGPLPFGAAIVALKKGHRVARSGWNGKGMWLVLVPGTQAAQLRDNTPYAKAGLTVVDINPHIDMFTADGKMQPGWLASQTDILAEDWVVL